MAAGSEFVDELKRQAVHVGHREHGYQLGTGLQLQYLVGKLQVRPQAAIREHHSLGVAGGARCIVDDGQFFRLVLMVVDMLFAEVLGVFPAEHLVEVLAGIGDPFVAADEQGEVVHHEDALQQRHGTFVQVLPHLVAYKE